MQEIFLLKQSNQFIAHRWTEQFEALRMRTESYKQRTKDNVKVFLANMGPIPQHKTSLRTSPQASSK